MPLDIVVNGGVSLVLGFVRALLVSQFVSLPYQFDANVQPASQYDFIIVGAGVAGSVTASRLSETGATVLVLEAGTDAPPESAVPGLDPLMYLRTQDWKYNAKPSSNSMLAYLERSKNIRSGKTIGGSSVLSGLQFFRANKMDMDSWARMGNKGWDYNSVLPYFKKSEDYKGPLTKENAAYHSQRGLLRVIQKSTSGMLLETFLKAGKELGYKIMDPSIPNQTGFTPTYVTIRDGVRATASESFLRPAISRPNLTVVPRATVRRILLNRSKRAAGVEYVYNNKIHRVRCAKEVILSAGALNTPKILMLSGVGPKEHLQQLGIPVVASVPGVGKNLQNHPMTVLAFRVKNDTTAPMFHGLTIEAVKEYLTNRKGIMADQWAGEGFAFLNLNGDNPNWPDVSIAATSLSIAGTDPSVIESTLGLKSEFVEDIYGPIGRNDDISMNLFVARPKSRGSVTLKSRDFRDPAIVEDEPCSHPDDMNLVIKGIRRCFDIANTRAMRNTMNTAYVSNPLRACSQYESYSDDYWRCYVKQTTVAGMHFTGTSKMAPRSDPLGVVTPRLRVRGVIGLRVIDGSIMPAIVSPNPMATVYMIGEKGADMVKEDWGFSLLKY